VPDTSLPGLRVVRELDALITARGRPAMCVSDNGTELTGMAILRWSQSMQVEWHYIAPGKPQQKVTQCVPAAASPYDVSFVWPKIVPQAWWT
jgi:hypothetical protein